MSSKFAARFFAVIVVLISDAMCAVVAYNYCTLQWGGEYAGYSAPASTAFLLGIPFLVAIVICGGLAGGSIGQQKGMIKNKRGG